MIISSYKLCTDYCFLIHNQASIKDTIQAYTAIDRRLGALKRGQRETTESNQTEDESVEDPNKLNDDDQDDDDEDEDEDEEKKTN